MDLDAPSRQSAHMSSSEAAAATAAPPPYVVEDCRGVVRVYSDGSIVRSPDPPFAVPIIDDGGVEWEDALYDAGLGLQLRIYRPRSGAEARLPTLLYFHGGGFCMGSRTWSNFHACCLRLSAALPAVVLSVDYRLAPEHRLPAAIDDATSALLWLRSSPVPHPWISESADLSRLFISGESAGGNITHNLAVLFSGAPVLPAVVRGLVLIQPAFGGTPATASEMDCPAMAFLTPELCERYWRLVPPLGSGRDHPLLNPFGPESVALEGVELPPMVVIIGGKDILRDREKEYCERLKGMGKKVEMVVMEGEEHAFFTLDVWSPAAEELIAVVKKFVQDYST